MSEIIISLAHQKLAKVYLRPLEMDDVEKCTKWINDPEIRQFLTIRNFPSLMEKKNFIESRSKDEIVLAIVTKEKNIHIGNIGIHGIDWINRRGTTGALIGEKEYQEHGFGTEAKLLLLKYAFDTLGFEKVCSNVLSTNPRSKAYLEKTGYKEEGCLRRHVRVDGKMVDDFAMAIFREDFIPVWKKYTDEEMSA